MQSTSSTHQPHAVAPEAFRARATGTGNTVSASRAGGAARAQRVAECMPEAARKAVAPAQGYPRG